MATCSGQDFVDLLKKIGYPGVETLSASGFDWMFEDSELIPFLETLCFDIQDENILSADELEEYKEFQANEMLDISQTEKVQIVSEASAISKSSEREISELKEDITETERHLELLEMQRDHLNVHILEVFEETKQMKDQKKDFEKRIMAVKEDILPTSVEKFLATVNTTVHLVKELDALLKQQPDDVIINPPKAFFQVAIEPYLETESAMLERISTYLTDSFKKCVSKVNDTFVEDIPGALTQEVSSKELQAKQATKALRLRDIMQSTHVTYFKSVLETNKMEMEIRFLEELMQNGLTACNVPLAQLQNRLENVQKSLKEVEREEEHILEKLPNVIRDYLKAQYDWVAILCSSEKLNRYKMYLELLERPLDIIYEQRARLEFLKMALTIEENNLKDIKRGVTFFKQKLENEANECQERLVMQVSQSEEKPKDLNCVSESSVLFTLNEVMGDVDKESNSQLLYLTSSDVVDKAKKLKAYEDNLIDESTKMYHEQVLLLKSAEENLTVFEKYAHSDHQNYEDHPSFLVDKLTMNIGLLASKIASLDENFLNTRGKYVAKEELISRNNNVALSRELFVYALTDQKIFKKAIKEIKDRVEVYEQRKTAIRNAS